MSIHISAKKNQIADVVLLPGDPLRAKFIAETFLTEVECYSRVRNMLGFTGFTKSGLRISTQGSGMGMPTLSIYINELIKDYGVKKIIRAGSCGALKQDIKMRDVIIAQGACTDSAMLTERFAHRHFAPIADFDLLYKIYNAALALRIPVRVGNIFATDFFYNDANPDIWKLFADYGVLAVEMETAELYTVAAKNQIQALTILQVSDHLITKESLGVEEREKAFTEMIEIILAMLKN